MGKIENLNEHDNSALLTQELGEGFDIFDIEGKDEEGAKLPYDYVELLGEIIREMRLDPNKPLLAHRRDVV